MGKVVSRRGDVTRISSLPAHLGSRAVFLAEACTRKEIRQIRELFDMVGQLAQVVPISHGRVMSYAVQVDGDTSLFGKIEWLLKTQFTFSLVERNFSDVTFSLVRSLCEESETQMAEVPQCGICSTTDPFPTRASVERFGYEQPLHLAFCGRCAARYAEVDEEAAARTLVRRHKLHLRVGDEVPVRMMPEIVDDKPEQDSEHIAIAV